MKKFLFVFTFVFAAAALCAQTPTPPKKNWTPPAYKIYAQTLSDQIMTAHPELISVTLHGVPPGMKDVYTMFAGSFPERIGNPDDDDDITFDAGSARSSFCSSRPSYRGERPQVRRLAVGEKDGDPFLEHTLENVQNRTYPLKSEVYFYAAMLPGQKMNPGVREFLRFVLSQEGQAEVQRDGKYPLVRSIYIYLNRKPGTALDPKLREFLRFILSREGQQIVAEDGGFLPLPAAVADKQRAKIN